MRSRLFAIGGAIGVGLCFLTTSPAQNANQPAAEIRVTKVQGNVYLLAGAGGNITVQTGDMGVVVVDTGLAQNADKVIAAIKKLSDLPIQHVINTHVHADHTGGNLAVRLAGLTYVGANVTANLKDAGVGARLHSQDNVLQRMSAPTGGQAAAPFDAWPTETFLTGRKQLWFNGEPVEIIHQPKAHTDGDSIVFFRHSDVISTGDIFNMNNFPFIDIERGGSIQGEIDALNTILETTVVGIQDEGGTLLVPGHGRIADQPELLGYRDMVTIIRDRVQAAVKKGMTLQQVKAAAYTKDYDGRWSAKQGPSTGDAFVEAVYKSLTVKK
jgi:cyclase